jgi:flagellar biosynthesis/type III secretory pathway M-ring protein FliF/YscJ
MNPCSTTFYQVVIALNMMVVMFNAVVIVLLTTKMMRRRNKKGQGATPKPTISIQAENEYEQAETISKKICDDDEDIYDVPQEKPYENLRGPKPYCSDYENGVEFHKSSLSANYLQVR